jgi:polar amino acid transport system substrate-binding protein
MKKFLALVLALIMLLTFTACGEQTHSKKVKRAGTLVVGVTDFEPMTYQKGDEWTGFDAEFAKLFAKAKLNANVKFVEIKANERFEKLENGEIDCVWSGLTQLQGDEFKASYSNSYAKSVQMLVMKADRVNNYNDGFQIKDLNFVVEETSAGAFYTVIRNGFRNIEQLETKAQVMDKILNGEADATVIDAVYASAVTREGAKYADLGIGFDFSSDGYCVAFPTESDLTDILNDYIAEIKDSELKNLSEKYGITLY